jgi:hypothetical protein
MVIWDGGLVSMLVILKDNLVAAQRVLILAMLSLFVAGCSAAVSESETTGFRQRKPEDPIADIVGFEEFDFGTAQIGDTGSHIFEIRNAGQSDLILTPVNVDDSGVAARVEGSPIPPGKTAQLLVEWSIEYYEENYLQNIQVDTNDPELPSLSLRVMGRVPPAVRQQQSRLGYRNVRASEGFEGFFDIYAYFDEDLEILGHEWLDPETESFFEVRYEDLSLDHESLVGNEEVKSAVRIWVRALPGMPSGIFREAITVTTNKDTQRPIQVGVLADVRGALTLEAGPGLNYDPEVNVVDLGRVNRYSKKTATLNIAVNLSEIKGDTLHLEVEHVDPSDVLSIEIGEAKVVGKGLIIPVELTLQGNGQSISRMGPTEDLLGSVRLKAAGDSGETLEFLVKFAITQ